MKTLTADTARALLARMKENATHSQPTIHEGYTIQALEIALPVLEQQGGWISCSERMPEDGQWKQVWDGVSVVIAYFYKDYGHFVRDNGDELYRVTHWQPLTSPPQPQPSNPQIDNDDWIEWHGGKCPVEATDIVEVKLDSGELGGARMACGWVWQRVSKKTLRANIIAYRVIENDGREG